MIIIKIQDDFSVADENGLSLTKEQWKEVKQSVDAFYKSLSKRKSKNQSLVKHNDQQVLDFYRGVRLQYPISQKNRFIKYFGNHQTQLYSTISFRINENYFTLEDVKRNFEVMCLPQDFSVMDFFGGINTKKYTNFHKLMDFLWVMMDGKVGNDGIEKKGASELSTWIEQGKTTLREIEDCFLWLPNSGRGYKPTLMAVKSALGEFSMRKKEFNGRSTAKPIGVKTKDEKTVENLENRDYISLAQESLDEMESRKNRLKELAK